MGLIKCRCVLWVMIFTACFVSYMNRINMSINILAMVQKKSGSESEKNEGKVEPLTEKFSWTEHQQGNILGAYFYGYSITSFIGGTVAEYFGPRYTLLLFTLISGALTLITPMASRVHYIALVAVRVGLGLAGGFTYPALHCLIAHWIPQIEKGKFSSALMGGTFGTVITWSITGLILKPVGWQICFYIAGILTILWAIFWWYLIYDSPNKHPRIDEEEKKYILDLLADKVQDMKGLPPYLKIFTSFPFLGMVVLHYGNLWGLYFIMTMGPKFIKTALKFPYESGGFTSSLPPLSRVTFSIGFGSLGDWLLRTNRMTAQRMRKIFCLFSHIIPGFFLILNGTVARTAAVSIALLTMSMGSNGAATLTNLQNHQDLSPNYAGTLYGIANGIGSSAGILAPKAAAALIGDGEAIENWSSTFILGAAVYIGAAIFFIIFGRTEIQPWNYKDSKVPAPTEPKPAPTETKPAPTETKPAPTETKPAPTETKPAPTETKPAPTETKPAPTETKPAPTETKPARPVEAVAE